MANMTKGAFSSIDGKTKKMTPRSGYLFDLLLADNTVKHMGVYQATDKKWYVIDIDTGKALCSSETRKNAVAIAESDAVVRRFTEIVNSPEYRKFGAPKAPAKAAKPKAPAKPKGAKPKAPKPPVKSTAPKAPKAPKKKAAPKRKEVEQATVVSLETLLSEMREWCKSHPNTAAFRLPGSGSTVRVSGVLKPDVAWQKELMGLGFRFARGPQVWMYDIRKAEKDGKTVIDGR